MASSTCADCGNENTAQELAHDTIDEIETQLGDVVRVYEVECLDCGLLWEEPSGQILASVTALPVAVGQSHDTSSRRLAS